MPAKSLNIQGRRLGDDSPCFVLAEAGVNHNGSLDRALRLIDAAADAGADAVKFQTFKAQRLVTRDAPQAEYQKANTGSDRSQFAMLSELELADDDHLALIDHCRQRGLWFISTPFDEQSADLLAELNVPLLKIPSGEVPNLPYLDHVARLGLPLILSTGMCRISEVEAAIETIEATGNTDYIVLHCTSNYPCDPAEANLRAMATMSAAFQCPVGYSDHTLGDEVAIAAVALGACVLEKHFTLDRELPGPDHKASLEPAELAAMIRRIRVIESALGSGRKTPTPSELGTAKVARKSLVADREIAAGCRIDDADIAIRRPGTGLPPTMKPYLLNRTARETIPAGTLLKLEMVS